MTSVASVENDDDEGFPHPFGQYLLLENFARGGMGEVYLAKYGDVVEKYCVLKKLRRELTRDREYVTRFIDEARVVVTLNHANICHVFDVGRVGDEYYLAMEYVSGRDVRTIMDRAVKRERPIPAACALQLTCETLEALDYAHRRVHPMTQEALNLVHRDVSPQNVLVAYEGEVKLIDFGLAASKLKVERTQPNVVMGKMAYMAPEQARGDPIDARADLFACGVLCYELLAGERFYEGMSANDIWNVAGKGGFVPRRWDAIDPEVAKLLAKALHPDPKKRFATCGDFREALASHMHWRFPGSGVKSLRDVMSDLFGDEMAREREMLARFGKVTIQSFRGEMESTQSHSISLAAASNPAAAAAAQVVRNEQSQSGDSAMPPPVRDGGKDVHVEPTRIGAMSDTAATGKARSTDEQSALSAVAQPTREATARVVRTTSAQAEPTTLVRDRERVHPATQIVRDRNVVLHDLNSAEHAAVSGSRRSVAYGAGIGLAVLAGVVAFFVTRTEGDDVVNTTHAASASVRASVPDPEPSPPPLVVVTDAGPPVAASIATVADAGFAPIAVVSPPPPAPDPIASVPDPPAPAVSTAARTDDDRRTKRDRDRRAKAAAAAAEQERIEKERADEKARLAAQAEERRVREAAQAKAQAETAAKAGLSDVKLNKLVKTLVEKNVSCAGVVRASHSKWTQDSSASARADLERVATDCARRNKIEIR